MLNFNSVVSNILSEEEQQQQNVAMPEWVNRILKHHSKLGFSDIKPGDPTLNQIIQTVYRPNQNRLADKEVERVYDGVRVLDALERFKKQTSPKLNDYNKGLNDFILASNTNPEYKKKGEDIATAIEKYQNGQQWVPMDSDVSYAWGKLLEGQDKMASVALSTFNNLSIIEAVKQMVKRRTNIFDRISNLKSLSQPFTQLITDIFKTPAPYASGAKKVSSDYFNIVDNLYVTSIIEVAQYAKEFFKAEIASKKVSPQSTDNTQNPNNPTASQPTPTNPSPEAQPTPSAATPPAPFRGRVGTYDSLNFDSYLNSILISEANILQRAGQAISQSTVGRGVQALNRGVQKAGKALMRGERELRMTPQTKQRYEQYKKHLEQDQANYDAFLNGKVIKYKVVDTQTNQETETVKETGPYTIGVISKIETTEAKNLIGALLRIAQYTRKGVGAGERLRHAGAAMGAAAGFGGAKLYG